MGYRKLKADQLFDGFGFIGDKVLVVTADGVIDNIIDAEAAGDGVEVYKGILSPGFINCHCHLELSHMKGLIPENTGLVDFVFKVVTERHHSEEQILQAIEHAETEMLGNGIVAAGDICNNSLTIPQKQKKRLQYYNFIEASGWLPSISQMRYERAQNLSSEFARLSFPFSVVPHAPYSVSENLWKAIQPGFKNKVATIHNQETGFEDEFFQKGTGDFRRMYELLRIDNSHHQPTGLSSVRSYIKELNGAENVILVHNTYTSRSDIEWIRSADRRFHPSLFFCLCVNANQYIENALPPVALLRKNKCTIVLGTDSLASNWSLCMLDEIRTIRENFKDIPFEEMLQWATSNGARALQLDRQLGSFEKGKKPGVVLINENELTAQRLA